ncbi:MAG: hypothetical protein ACLR23_03805 [Clostridia bacterium]
MEKEEKRGQRRGAGQRKCPPVEKVTRVSGVEKGEKGGQRRGPVQRKMPAGRESHESVRRGERGERGQSRGPVQGKCPPVKGTKERPNIVPNPISLEMIPTQYRPAKSACEAG